MHFTYEASLCQTELMQGDVLARTPEIESLLKSIHPHFFNNAKNSFFIVLTQSCGLVPSTDGTCKAPYITIAPVRALNFVIESQLEQLGSAAVNAELPVLSAKSKTKASEFLQRLFNNNEQGYLFLESTGTSLPTDCVAFLNLSIAIKANLHYKSCLDAKVLQLTDTFQAKLGWLVGQMYSRVGTLDWDKAKLNTKISGALNKDAAIWVDDDNLKALESGHYFLDSDPAIKKSRTDIAKAIKAIPARKKQVLDQAQGVIAGAIRDHNSSQVAKFRKRLENELDLTMLLNQHILEQSEQVITETPLQDNEHQVEILSKQPESSIDMTTLIQQQILDKAVEIITEILKDNQAQINFLRKRLDGDQALNTFIK